PSLRRAVVPLGKPGRLFGGETAVEPTVEGNGKHEIEPAFEPAMERLEAVGRVHTSEQIGPVVDQREMPAVAESITQPEWFAPQPELLEVETPQPVAAEPQELTIPELEPVIAQTEELTIPEMEPVIAEAAPIFEPIFEPEIEPVGQGQPIPQLTPVEEPSIIEVTEPEPAGFEAFRQPSEPTVSPEPVFESRIYEPTTPVTMPEPVQIPTAPAGRGGMPQPAG